MKTTATIGILKTTIGNPVTRKILKSVSNYYDKDKKTV
jgi:hypothetical protein